MRETFGNTHLWWTDRWKSYFAFLLIPSCFSGINVMAGAPTVFLTCEIKLHAKDIKEERKTECPTPMMLSYLSWKKKYIQATIFCIPWYKQSNWIMEPERKINNPNIPLWSFNYSKIYIRQTSKAFSYARNFCAI